MRIILSIISLVFVVLSSFAEDNLSAAENLRRGLAEFKDGKYQQASLRFERTASGNSIYADAALFLSAKTKIRMGRFSDAKDTISKLKSRFPQSRYIDFALYMEAEAIYRTGPHFEAYRKLLQIWESTTYSGLKDLAEDKLLLLLGELDDRELDSLRSSLSSRSKAFIDKNLKYSSSEAKIVLFYDPADSEAEGIMAGMELCLDLYHRANKTDKPKLIIAETDKPGIEQYLYIKKLKDEPVAAIISCMKGEQLLLQAAAGSGTDIPFFIIQDDTPELYRMGDNIWQLRPSQDVQGEALAEYAAVNMGLKRFASLSPLDGNGQYFSSGFADKIKSLKGEIAIQEWYYSGAKDLGKNFKSIRQTGFKLAYQDSIQALFAGKQLLLDNSIKGKFADSLRVKADSAHFMLKKLTPEIIDKLWNEHRRSAMESFHFSRTIPDSSDITLSCYHGFVFPLTEDDVEMYISQFAYYNFKTQLFSTGQAFTPTVLQKNKNHLKRIKLSDWNNRRRNYDKFYSLSDKFREKMGRAPYDNEVLGYDSMNFVLYYLNTINKHSENASNKEIVFEGVNYDFGFPVGVRSNQSVNIFEFNGSELVATEPAKQAGGK